MHFIWRLTISRHMTFIEHKHLALITEADRRGSGETENLRACFEVLALATAIDRDCAARLAPHQLSEGKFVLLFLLREQKEGLSPHELAERAGVTRATVTGLLDGLERDDYLRRQAHETDRRKSRVILTAKGEETAAALFDEHTRWIATLFADFTAAERQVLSGLLARVRGRLGAAA